MSKIVDISTNRIAYVDETGIDQYLYREYGWSKRWDKVYGKVSGRKYRRTGIVAAQMEKQIIAPMQYVGTMDSLLFETWFEKCLLPILPKNSVIVMDNATFHRKSKLPNIAEQNGHNLIFLPPYSPELNPIENFWSWIKRSLKKLLPFYPSFDYALSACFQVY